jgi:RNA polymerase sigma-70 factor (ECF subfamily)
MTDNEFTDIATELRELALKKGRGYPLATDDADDIAQETMLRLWALRRKVNSLRHARGLAVCIAAHLAIDRLRRRRTVSDDFIVNEQPSSNDPETDLELKVNDEWLEKELSRLPSTEYQVLHLRQVEGKTNEEIASIIGITPQSVATLLSRARRKLMEKIKRR